MKISRIIFVTLIFLASCGDNEPMKYQEYHRDATKTLFELLEFKAEFQKCYGKPLHYDAAAKHYVYNEFAFHGGDNLSHFSLIIQKLAVRLDAFIKRYQEKTPEREFVSLFIFGNWDRLFKMQVKRSTKLLKVSFRRSLFVWERHFITWISWSLMRRSGLRSMKF